MVAVSGYGAVPPGTGPAPGRGPGGRQFQVALLGLAIVAAVATATAYRALSPSQAPVVLGSSGSSGWLSELESQFSDKPTSMHEKAVRMQLAGRPSPAVPAWQNLAKSSSIGQGYTDGMTGARLDQLTPAGVTDPNNVAEEEKQQMVTNLTRSGVEVDHWPWDSPEDDKDEPLQHHVYQKKRCQWKAGFYSCWEDELPFEGKGTTTQLRAKQDSIMGDIMGAFADAPHRNPMLSKSQMQALKAQNAKNSAKASASAGRGIPQKDLERLARSQHRRQEKMAMRKSAMLARLAHASEARKPPAMGRQMRKMQDRKPQLRSAFKYHSPLQQLEGEKGDEEGAEGDGAEWGVDVAWNGHNDRCSETTPNCNALGKRGDAQPGVHVYGWPWDEDATQAMKQKQLAVALQGDATQLLRLTASRSGNADAEEKAAEALQARSFDMFKLASFQKLEEDDVSNATKVRVEMFPKWYWTPDSTEYLEKDHGIPVDQWPWEDCHGVDCKHAVDERRWERAVGQKLHQDAADMSELADADAQMGLFPKLEALEEEDSVSVPMRAFPAIVLCCRTSGSECGEKTPPPQKCLPQEANACWEHEEE